MKTEEIESLKQRIRDLNEKRSTSQYMADVSQSLLMLNHFQSRANRYALRMQELSTKLKKLLK